MSSTAPTDSPSRQTTLKDRLDEAAEESHRPQTSNSPGLLEKVTEYVPAASKILGTDKNSQERHGENSPKSLAGPPHRPEHDAHIAEFIREQHRSKKPDGSLNI